MFCLVSGGHICVPQRDTKMAAPYISYYRKARLMKRTHDSLLLRVSCLRTHQTVFNKENSYQQVYIQACEKSYCYYIITMHVRELSKGVGPE